MQIQFDYDSIGEPVSEVEIADGITFLLPAPVHFFGLDIDGSPYDVSMVLRMTSEGVRPAQVAVAARDGSPHITGTTLRAVKVWDLAIRAIRLGLDRVGGEATMLSDERAKQLQLRAPRTRRFGGSHLLQPRRPIGFAPCTPG